MLCKHILTLVLHDYTCICKKRETVTLSKETTESELNEGSLKYSNFFRVIN